LLSEVCLPDSPVVSRLLRELECDAQQHLLRSCTLRGAYLWFADEPFSQSEQAAGRFAIDRIRAGFGDLRPFDFTYVYKFRSEEIELLTTFIILAIVLLWDVYILTGWRDRIVHISHDGLFGVYAKDTETKLRINEAFPKAFLGEYPK